jgi:hypothetical protein
MKNKGYKLISLCFLLVFLSSCNASQKKVSSIIIDKSCSPPCWENITPGSTTREEANTRLKEISYIGSIKDSSIVSDNDSKTWEGKSSAGDFSGDIFFDNDIVTLISVSPKKGVLIFSDLTEKLGEPENVFVVYTGGERSILTVFILYPSKGFGFLDYYYASNNPPQNAIQVKPEEDVKYIWYCEPKYFYDFLTSGQIGRFTIGFIEEGIQKWNGFSEYKYIENK